jgi:hypothetical protein
MQNTFIKIKNAELLTSGASFQTFTKTVQNTRHVNYVAWSNVHHILCKSVTTGARNVIRSIMKFVLGPWAESSSYAEYARDSEA